MLKIKYFANQEFINSLTMQNTPQSKNIIKRVYESIKRLLNNFTQEGQYKNLLQDLESKWRETYRNATTNQTINNLFKNKFSIQQDSNGNKYVNVDTNQDIFNGVNPKDYSKVAKQYILDNFREKGINFGEENIDVSSRTAKEYAYPKAKLPYYIKDSKTKASTELDNLLNVSIYQYSTNDDGRHSFATDGWDYYKTKFTVGNKTFEGLVNIGKNGNKKTLYDITNLKEVPYIGTSGKTFSESLRTPLNDNTLSQNDDKVKLPVNYSMQESQNNTHEIDNSYIS